MRARILRAALAVCVAASSAPALAEGGRHISNEPGATLLLPYFEVALPKKPTGKQKGVNTIFTITNASASAALAHVVIWSDLGVPVQLFDVYLTGWDVETIDLFEVIHGRLPQTASVGQDLSDEISPQGFASQDLNFASCTGILPPEPQLPAESVEHMRASLTGQPSPLFANQCFGRDYDEKKPIARGYVTVDNVFACSLLFPSSPAYTTVLYDVNQLHGEWFITNGKKSVYGDSLVSVRADAAEFVPGDYTFYSRFVGDLATDHRQPLANAFAARFANDPKDALFPGGTSLIVWRDVKKPQDPFDCSTTPSFYPLAQTQILAFDEEENVEEPQLPAIPPLPPEVITPFPGAAQRVPVGGDELPVTFARGFMLMNLGTVVLDQTTNVTDPIAQQNFVTGVHSTKKQSTAIRGTALDDANNANHSIVSVP